MTTFSNAEKLKELKRELGMRRHVYTSRVANKQMTQADADRKIAICEAMIADYEQAAARDAPSLL